MKGVIVATCILIASTNADIFGILMSGVEDSGKVCIPQVGATVDDLHSIMSHRVPTSSAGKCLVACIQKKFGIQSEDGLLNKEGTLRSIDPLKDTDREAYEKLKPIFENCLEEVRDGKDECTTGAEFKQCILDNLD